MTPEKILEQIDSIAVTEEYKDREGRYIGKRLARWVDVKPEVLNIIQQWAEEAQEVKTDAETEYLRNVDE